VIWLDRFADAGKPLWMNFMSSTKKVAGFEVGAA
jgi:hypothetical protein